MSDAVVLVVVEGGIVQETINIRGTVETRVLDWDVVDEGSFFEVQDAFDMIAGLPAAPGFDKQGILETIEKRLRDFPEFTDE